jgi:hypothetical protein
MTFLSARMDSPMAAKYLLSHLGAALVWLALSGITFAQSPQPSSFLESAAKLTKAQLAAVGSGQPVALTPATANKTEVEGIGAVRILVPSDFFVAQYRNIREFKKAAQVLQIGRFSEPATEADMASLMVDPSDLRALQKCIPGSCSVKMSATLLANYRRFAGDSASNTQRSAAFRHVLVDYVNDYRRRGDAALLVYDDEAVEVNVAHEFHDLLGGFQVLRQYAPEFVEYLDGRSGSHLENTDDFIYWSKEDAGFKAVTSLTHVTIYQKIIQNRAWYFIASKNIYSNHYVESSLGISVISEDPGGGCWLVYVNRSRTDILRGFLSSLRRTLIESRVKSVMRKQLAATKKKLEDSFPKAKD